MLKIVNKIVFPEFKGIKCNMMPFIQGNPTSLPKYLQTYSDIVKNNFLEKGEIGFLTIDESFVSAGKSQRGYNSTGSDRNVHMEVSVKPKLNCWGGGGGTSWGRGYKVTLDDKTMVLIANNISNSCRVWDSAEKLNSSDGDLTAYLDKFPEKTGLFLKEGELAKISIFTPHECVNQIEDQNRQFFRIVGKGVQGREDYFTINPILK